MLSWRSGKARIWGTEGPRFEPHSSYPYEVPAAVDPWANRGSWKDAGIAQIRAVSRGDIDTTRPKPTKPHLESKLSTSPKLSFRFATDNILRFHLLMRYIKGTSTLICLSIRMAINEEI
ncbi:hypothetical protein R6Q59_036916 [Mikania micrantha]